MARNSNTHVFIEMDSNAKLGKELVTGDPHSQTVNGQHLAWVIEENDLVVVNGSKVSEGIITRYRETVNGVEEAVLDHVLVSRDLFEVIEKMVVDEAGAYALTKFTSKKGNSNCVKDSDHRTIITTLNLQWSSRYDEKKQDRSEIFNFKDSAGFEKFVEFTTNNKKLEEAFKTDEGIETSSRRWLSLLKGYIKASFKKIRVRKPCFPPELEKFFQEKEVLRQKVAKSNDKKDKEDLSSVESKISSICAERNRNYIRHYIGQNTDTTEGFSHAKTWNIKKKLMPKIQLKLLLLKKINLET